MPGSMKIAMCLTLLLSGSIGVASETQVAPGCHGRTAAGLSRWVPVEFATHRSTDAYIGDRTTMQMLAPDEPINRQAVACSITDGEYITGPGGVRLIPFCRNSHFLFAKGANSCLYRTADGVDWQDLGVPGVSHIFALADDTLIRDDRPLPEPVQVLFYRSEDDGETWEDCLWADTGEHFVWLTPDATLVHWGHHQAANGTIVMVEYKLPWGGRYAYRSSDSGRTWSMVLDNGGIPKHFHAVTKQEALNRWITVTGDNISNRFVYASDDDGQNWYEYCPAGQLFFQPTQLLDYGDSTKLLFGSDLTWQVGTFDASDGPDARKIRQLITNWDSRWLRGYCFLLFQHDGVFYACQTDNSGSGGDENSVISVSTDLENWGVYHRFSAGTQGAFAFAGALEGKLYLDIHPAQECFRVSGVETAVHTATAVMPGTVNLFSDAVSIGSTLAGWNNVSQLIDGSRGTLEVLPSGGQMGDACLHYFREDGGQMQLRTPPITVQPGRTYQARFWIRGNAGVCLAPWNVSDGPYPAYFGLNEEWHEVVTAPFTARPDTTNLTIFIEAFSLYTDQCEAYIDSLQFEECPSTSWHPGGQTRDATTLSASVSTDGPWTDVFTIEPDARSDGLATLPSLNIRRYTDSSGGVLELTWDPAESRFVLSSSIDGLIREQIMSTPQDFQLRAHVCFAIRCDADRLSLALSNGQPIERITSVNPIGVAAGPLAIECGVGPDKKVLPHAVFNERFFGQYLDDEALDAAMNDVGTPPVAPTGATASPNPVCAGQDVLLTAEGGSGGTYTWYTDECGTAGPIGTGESISVVAAASATTYFVRMEGPDGNSACASVGLDIIPPDLAPASASASPSPVCAGEQVRMSAQGGSGGTYTWYSGGCGDAAPVGSGQSLEITAPSDSTRYYVRTEGACGVSRCASVMVRVNSSMRWYRDADSDGYGDLSESLDQCARPAGYVSNPDDCDDTDASPPGRRQSV